jgi:outer membrane protein assembly factor BamB
MTRSPCAFAVLTAALLSGPAAAEHGGPATTPKAAPADWPWWRGPAWDGKSRDRRAITTWGPTKNVVWKANVPGRGHSSPVVCGGRVFLTTADEAAQKQFILAFDRKTGRPLWSTLAHEGGFLRLNPKNSQASATPACDGTRVYSAFVNRGGLHVTATDLDGKILWQKKAGAFESEHGYGSSPVLYGPLVIVNGDSLRGCFVAALEARSGKVVWKADRKTTGRHGSYATPLVARLAGRPQLILTGMGEVSSYDPDTGKLLWACAGPAEVTACTPACDDTVVFATGGFPEKHIVAVRADGAGDVTKSHLLWDSTKGVSYVPSPVYHAGRLYVVNDGGVATCFEAKTGRPVWQGRLPAGFSASPVLVGDLLYAASESGNTFVLRAGPRFEVVAESSLGEGIMATPAVCGGQVFLRTAGHLYCLGSRTEARGQGGR